MSPRVISGVTRSDNHGLHKVRQVPAQSLPLNMSGYGAMPKRPAKLSNIGNKLFPQQPKAYPYHQS